MKIKKYIECGIVINNDSDSLVCTLKNGNIIVPLINGKEAILSIKAAYYVVSYTPDTDVFQQFTITAKCNNYYYDCTINTTTGDKSLLVRDSYHNNILVIDGNFLEKAVDSLYELESIKIDNGIPVL